MGSLQVLSEYFSRAEVEYLAEELSRFHRIQGSPGLEDAGKFIRDVLADWGLEVRVYDLPYSSEAFPTSAPIIGWFVEDGYAEIVKPRRKVISSLKHAWTAVIAHSPPGEFEGKVCYAPTYKHVAQCRDKIVLTPDWGFDTYVGAVEAGAIAVIAFRRSAPPTAYPYYGLFPTTRDVSYLKIPALTTTCEVAEEIIAQLEKGEEVVVRGYVRSGYREVAYARVVEASIGRSSEGEYHLVAHYCHPGATVNDNVSGSVGVLSAARAASLAMREGRLEIKDRAVKFVWVPEHHGTARYLTEVFREGRRVMGAVNLDMIGEKQCETNSVLNLVRAPIRLLSKLEASVYSSLMSSLPRGSSFSSPAEFPLLRFFIINYETGSDHDVYVSLGIPAVMLNQWPDRYYHTSEDTLEMMSSRLVYNIGVASLAAILELDRIRIEPYVHMVYGLDTMKVSGLPLEARYYLYGKVSKELGVDLKVPEIQPPTGGESVRLVREGYLTSLYIRYKLGVDFTRKLREELQDKFRYSMLALAVAGVYLLEGAKDVERLRFEVSGELGVEVPREVFNTLLNVAENSGYIIRGR